MLKRAGHEVLNAVDGTQGVQAALTHVPDLILMDIAMPGMDGITALKQLRADPRTAGITVAALTAYAMRGERERFLAEGFDGYLDKPIRYKEFSAHVEAILARKVD
jgi:CheY-like chemotaxis protein